VLVFDVIDDTAPLHAVYNIIMHYIQMDDLVSLIPRPHLRERVWWHPTYSSGFINVDYFLERNFSPPNHIAEKTIHSATLESLARWHSTLFGK